MERHTIERREQLEEGIYTPTNQPIGKNCNLCSHQGVCSAFANFKIHVEPMLMDQKTTLKAENLAWICSLYSEKEPRKQGA